MTGIVYVQGDGTLLVQSQDERYDQVRTELMRFSELVRRLDPIHVYQIRPVILWQAAAQGVTPRQVLTVLRDHSAHPLPYTLQTLIASEMQKWGALTLHKGARKRIVLRGDVGLLQTVALIRDIQPLLLSKSRDGLVFRDIYRADVKRGLTRAGYPVHDLAGYQEAPRLDFVWNESTILRPYQEQAVQCFFTDHGEQSGVIVLPCGAGKTVVGIGISKETSTHTLVLTPSESSALQWQREWCGRTSLTEADVSLYDPYKELTPVTITTYQRVAAKNRAGDRKHLQRLTSYPWGLVIYDEVHMLPAPLFRLAADLQGVRRLGLTATLVREDGAETDVFSLIGGKLYDVPWKQLERDGYLSVVRCVEIRVPLSSEESLRYSKATVREQHRMGALNPLKLQVAQRLVERHPGESIIVIGHYLDSLHQLADRLDCPLITGQTPQAEREHWLTQFKSGVIRTLVLSRVANMAVDIPCASVAVQVSGLFGSRQEEAQRLGRLLRPTTKEGVFYTLVSRQTVEEKTAKHRQLYLVEQGYAYELWDADTLLQNDEVVGLQN